MMMDQEFIVCCGWQRLAHGLTATSEGDLISPGTLGKVWEVVGHLQKPLYSVCKVLARKNN